MLSARSWLHGASFSVAEMLFFFAHGGGGFETQMKKLLNDRNSQMDLRHASEYLMIMMI